MDSARCNEVTLRLLGRKINSHRKVIMSYFFLEKAREASDLDY